MTDWFYGSLRGVKGLFSVMMRLGARPEMKGIASTVGAWLFRLWSVDVLESGAEIQQVLIG